MVGVEAQRDSEFASRSEIENDFFFLNTEHQGWSKIQLPVLLRGTYEQLYDERCCLSLMYASVIFHRQGTGKIRLVANISIPALRTLAGDSRKPPQFENGLHLGRGLSRIC